MVRNKLNSAEENGTEGKHGHYYNYLPKNK